MQIDRDGVVLRLRRSSFDEYALPIRFDIQLIDNHLLEIGVNIGRMQIERRILQHNLRRQQMDVGLQTLVASGQVRPQQYFAGVRQFGTHIVPLQVGRQRVVPSRQRHKTRYGIILARNALAAQPAVESCIGVVDIDTQIAEITIGTIFQMRCRHRHGNGVGHVVVKAFEQQRVGRKPRNIKRSHQAFGSAHSHAKTQCIARLLASRLWQSDIVQHREITEKRLPTAFE